MSYLKPLAVFGIASFAVWRLLSSESIDRAPGVLAPEAPKQRVLNAGKPIAYGDFVLQPHAQYDIEARVLSVEHYHIGAEAELAPIDFAVGWGPMSDTAVLEHFRITQGARFYTIYPDEAAIDLTTALRASANMHLIPANETIRRLLLTTRPGNVVALQGYLVTAHRADGFTWSSSLSRDDTGAGACELMYVTAIERR